MPARKNDRQSTTSRIFHLCLAWICLAAGVVGVFLPLLPTTPFLLAALWGFSRSSPRLEKWLRTHDVLGPYISRWNRYGIVPVKVKVLAVAMMACSMIWLVWFGDVDRTVVAVVGVTLFAVALWLASRPSRPPRSTPGDASVTDATRPSGENGKPG